MGRRRYERKTTPPMTTTSGLGRRLTDQKSLRDQQLQYNGVRRSADVAPDK